jgi:hypothetical protein
VIGVRLRGAAAKCRRSALITSAALDPVAVIRGSKFLQRKLTIAPHIAGRKFLF